MLLKSSIELKLQPNSAWFNASYLKTHSLINTLEFNTLSMTEDFAYLLKPDLLISYIGTLKSEADQFSASFFESFKTRNALSESEMSKGIMMICDCEEQNYNYVYFLILGSDPFIKELNVDNNTLALFRFSIEEITENKLEVCEKIINQLRDVQKQMKQVFNNVVQEEVKMSREMVHHYDAIQYFHHENEKDREKKSSIEKKVRKKHQKIQQLHQEATRDANLYCSFCNNEKKNILFLPCGHIEVCKICLTQNLKIQLTAPHLRNKKCSRCNTHLESILEISY